MEGNIAFQLMLYVIWYLRFPMYKFAIHHMYENSAYMIVFQQHFIVLVFVNKVFYVVCNLYEFSIVSNNYILK